MTWKLVIKEDAVDDMIKAALWYEEQQSDLGTDFLNEIERLLNKIKSNPHLFQIQRKNVRYGFAIRFPYLVIYEIENSNIIVYAVIQAQRHPNKRYKRTRKN